MTIGTERVFLRDFSDVIKSGYTVFVSGGTVFESLFEDAPPGSGMRRVKEEGRLHVDQLGGKSFEYQVRISFPCKM